ncbi:M6 family metalloprotease domain-containing protein [Streptomyces sp. ST2-7A]|uniref:M6 family metalloprotease domain-containing protein n=1 Tax=Streptomyces sp. ST2-7A TaxID=2907214 RepID=UPI001F43883F|nr:M6 family metalloprotease domain-containing protein [Streptomyces sp. ST2-7A]MCE7081896.1 M6 family metalloprotease domain-containing protein [Streptomyces sp. ST2-7A]
MALITTVLLALTGLAGRPAADPGAAGCALPRHPVHHSLGVSSGDGPDRSDHPAAVGEPEAAMVFLSFPDSEPRSAPERIAASYFPVTADFLHRASHGRFRLAPEIDDAWLPMPKPSTAYDIGRDWTPRGREAYVGDALDLVADHRPHLAGADILYLVADPNAPGVDADATKVVNLKHSITVAGHELRRVVTLFERDPPDRLVLAHETGHVLGLPDLYHRPDRPGGNWDRYVGDWDLMGSQFGLAPELFGWHRWKLGWLDDHQVDCPPVGGVTRHALRPLAAPPEPDGTGGPGAGTGASGTGDTRMVVVRTGPSEALVAEARLPIGNDRDLCVPGVLLYRVRSDVASTRGPIEVIDGRPDSAACHGRSVRPELADAPLDTGMTHRDPVSGVRFEVGEREPGGGWWLRVIRP